MIITYLILGVTLVYVVTVVIICHKPKGPSPQKEITGRL